MTQITAGRKLCSRTQESIVWNNVLLLTSNLGYIEKETFEKIFELAREVERMLKALIDSLDKKPLTP